MNTTTTTRLAGYAVINMETGATKKLYNVGSLAKANKFRNRLNAEKKDYVYETVQVVYEIPA